MNNFTGYQTKVTILCDGYHFDEHVCILQIITKGSFNSWKDRVHHLADNWSYNVLLDAIT